MSQAFDSNRVRRVDRWVGFGITSQVLGESWLKKLIPLEGTIMKIALNHIKSITFVVGVILAMSAGNVHAQEASKTGASKFSFDVYGDSRSMMYLPWTGLSLLRIIKLPDDAWKLSLATG